MIQEKDFLYRVPVKNALVTAPGKQVRNPEILVDLEGGEFMHGNILDANSTNKLIDQSIKAEQTRAEGKEKEILDKLAIVDGDSNTEGSFRKAIADVIAAAPEDLDTLKEIADKLAGNDDLHTALNQAITEKADATALSNYVLTTALNQQIDKLNAAISAKQDAGNYIPCNPEYSDLYLIDNPISMKYGNQGITIRTDFIAFGGEDLSEATTLANNELYFTDRINSDASTTYSLNGITSSQHNNCLATSDGTFKPISDFALKTDIPQIDTSDFVSKIDITQYALKTELPTVPTNVSQLTNDSNFITYQDADAKYALVNSLNTVNDSISSLRVGLSKKQDKITVNDVDVTDIETADITKLRTIVINLIDALSTSGLIRTNSNLE